jgi:4-amino-4-deoxy-L-arabinose transferase-like glycosyltransferase
VVQLNDTKGAGLPAWRFPHPLLCWLTAITLLATMFLLMIGSAWEDSLTFDEPAHIAAGYAYVKFRDARLNYEHPPLLKMLASLPLLPLAPRFPLASSAWQDENNGQWETARIFLYESGNDPHRIATLARLGPMLLVLLCGLLLSIWTRQWAGDLPALLTLCLYVLSPTLLAHGRLVTTDVAAAFGVVLTGFTFSYWLAAPNLKTGLLTGLAIGLALLCKFSTFLLVPFMVALTLLWVVLCPKHAWRYLLGGVISTAIAALLVFVAYFWTTAHYPPERQLRDSYQALYWVGDGPTGRRVGETIETYFARLKQDRTSDLRACMHLQPLHQSSPLLSCAAGVVVFLADKPGLRAWGHYLYGLVWTLNRASVGTQAAFPFYFRGQVSVIGQPSFFPVVYAVKEPIPLHIITIGALIFACLRLRSKSWSLRAIADWLRSHPADTFMLSWIALYWSLSIHANLNIGIRHLLPVYPFTFMLVARETCRWLRVRGMTAFGASPAVCARGIGVAALLIWQGFSVVTVSPSFLAYFNEAVGGPEYGARYVVDSNLDWGQDLRRLRRFVDAQGIDRITVDYFGTSSARYELGEKLVPWRSALGPYEGWLAVSATVLKVAQARWETQLGHKAEDSYRWLEGKKPVAKIGYSIFVFDLRPEG